MKKSILFFFYFMYLIVWTCQGQNTCSWYSIYKEDFGGDPSSPAMGPVLPAGQTSYQYSTAIPVEDGFYGIRKQVRGHDEDGAWHQIPDHTGGGYMMLVNASYDPGLFYRATIGDLCQGTSFRFSAWVANLMRPDRMGNDPILRFVILNGLTDDEIKEYNTGTLGRESDLSNVWKEYGMEFDLPAGVSSVILEIYNNAPGGGGNDLALDDITFSICGPQLIMDEIGMYQDGDNVCEGGEVTLQASFSEDTYHNPAFQWQFSSDQVTWQDMEQKTKEKLELPQVSSSDSGWYRLLASEKGNIQLENCRISSAPIPVRVWKNEPVSILSGDPVCEGSELHLSVSDPSVISALWTLPDGTSSAELTLDFLQAELPDSGRYRVSTLNPGGCEAKASKNVVVQKNNLKLDFSDMNGTLCEGEVLALDATNRDSKYLWNTGATTPSLTVNSEGLYKVIVERGVCQVRDSLAIRYLEKPEVDLGPDTTICTGTVFILHATNSFVQDYLWNTGSKDSVLEITNSGNYSVTLKNQCGIATGQISIEMEPCVDELLFPTAFSPNGDGQNDIFRPKSFFPVRHYLLLIYDRWGKLVFRSEEPDRGWDGRFKGVKAPVGAYVWVARYFNEIRNKEVLQEGAFTLIR